MLEVILGVLFAVSDRQSDVLVSSLGSPSYLVREDASRWLRFYGDFSVVALEKGLKSPDLEVRRRSRECMAAWLDTFDAPEITRLGKDFAAVISFYAKPAIHWYEQDYHWSLNVGEKEATRDLCFDLIRAGWEPSRVVRLVRKMRGRKVWEYPKVYKMPDTQSWVSNPKPAKDELPRLLELISH